MGETEQEGPGGTQKRNRLIIAGIVGVTLAAAAFSLTANLRTMYDRWDAASTSRNTSTPIIPEIKLERLDIVSGDRRHAFSVEVMREEGDRARGLMFRRLLPRDQGMLFDFGREQVVTMWMKNTFIPLDMIFIRADGRIHRIESRAEPESERTISSGGPVKAVLELNADVAARLNLRAGDYIVHPMFK